MTVDRRSRLLIAVAGVLALVALVRYWPFNGAEEGLGGQRAASVASAAKSTSGEVVALDLPDLRTAPRSSSVGRDPWRFYVAPPPPPPPPHQPTKEELERMRLAEEEAARAAAERARLAAIEAARPKPPPITFHYLGTFGPKNRPIAVFSDGKDIVNAREGEILRGKFVVAKIGYESVDIKFVDFPDVPAQRLAVGR
ncbi:MAG TPA: hypothetical protein VN783_09705 [Thermoanaerobaculia bacterium]|nr:hypothetical protein [Thermoanaerobaculia bacterium]